MVLSAANLKSCAQAAHYYEADNYYAKNQGIEHSQWHGKAAQAQGLQNQITPAQFEAALHGQAANGVQLIADRRNRRPGTDLTFSAPKSVSLEALVHGKSEIIAAHTRAVQLALDYVERELIQSRVTHNKQTHTEKTGNLQAALWLHDTSRNLDPQLHTHAVLLNQTQCSDGKWRTVDNSQIFQHQLLVGAIYHNALAHELHQLGYQTQWNPDHTFEISGYTPTQLEQFSTRRVQIVELVGADASFQKRALATLQTRQKKQLDVDRDLLQRQWQAQAQAAGLSSISATPPVFVSPQRQTLLQTAQALLLNQDSAFSDKQLYREALRQNQGMVVPTVIEQDIQRQRLEQQLLLTTDQRYTTPEALQRDRQILELARRGQETQTPLTSPAVVQAIAQERTFTPGQQAALELIATTTDRVILVQGDAGTGKTYALAALSALAPADTLRGLAPSAAAAQTLATETGIPAQTLDSYLLDVNCLSHQTLIVDEAGLMSSRQMLGLLQKAEQTHSRLILIGDTKQLSSIEAGGPFGLLQRSGLATAFMTEGRRQQDPDLKMITDLAAQGQIRESYQHLEQTNRITQIRDPHQRITTVAQDYLSRSPQERSQTLILAGTNAEREAISQTIREGLKAEGSLSSQTLTLEVLKPKYLDAWAKKQAAYYELGDTIIFGTNYQHFSQGQPYRVTGIDLQSNSLILTDSQGQTYNSPCNQHVNRQVYQPRPLELAVGDQGRFTKNNPKRKQINGQPFRVTALDSSTGEITLYTKGWETTYQAQDLRFIDHNYVSTTYAAQGKTQNAVIWCVDTAHPQTLGKEAYYVAVSRERHDLQVYTDDPAALRQAILPSRAKINPSELLAPSSPSPQPPAPAIPATPLPAKPEPAPQPEPSFLGISPADLSAAIRNAQGHRAVTQLTEPLQTLKDCLDLVQHQQQQPEIESWQRYLTPLAQAIAERRDQIALSADPQLNQSLQDLIQDLGAYEPSSQPQALTDLSDAFIPTATPSNFQEQSLERSQSPAIDDPRNLSNSPGHSPDSSAGADRASRIQPYPFRTGPRELSEAISRAVERRRLQRLAGAVKDLSDRLEELQHSIADPNPAAEGLRDATARQHQPIADESGPATFSEYLKPLAAAIEQRALETDLALSQALAELIQTLETTSSPAHLAALEQLAVGIANATERLESQSQQTVSPILNDPSKPTNLVSDPVQPTEGSPADLDPQAQLSLNLGVTDEQSQQQPRSPRRQPQSRASNSPQSDRPAQRRTPEPQEAGPAGVQPAASGTTAGTPHPSRTPEPAASDPTSPSRAAANPGEIGDWLTELGQWLTELGQPQQPDRDSAAAVAADSSGLEPEHPDLAGPDHQPESERSSAGDHDAEAAARPPEPDRQSLSPDFAGLAQQQADLADQLRELAQRRQELAANPSQTGRVSPDPDPRREDRHLPGDINHARVHRNSQRHDSLDVDPATTPRHPQPDQRQGQQPRNSAETTQRPGQHPGDSAAADRAALKQNPAPSTQQPALVELSDQELGQQFLALQQWQESRPYKPFLSHGQQLKQDLEAQQQRRAHYQQVQQQASQTLAQLGKPRSLLNPFGPSPERIRIYQDQLREAQVNLWEIERTLPHAQHTFERWQQEARTYLSWQQDPNTQTMNQLAEAIQAPAIQQRLRDIRQRQNFHLAIQVILNIQGGAENHNRSVQGQTYRIEEQGHTLRIYRKDQAEPIYQAVGPRPDTGVVEIQQLRLTPEDREIILRYARDLQQQERQQGRQQQVERQRHRGRGFSR